MLRAAQGVLRAAGHAARAAALTAPCARTPATAVATGSLMGPLVARFSSLAMRPVAAVPALPRTVVSSPAVVQVRTITYGREYQPSTLKRKRKFGFRARMANKGGRKVIANRKWKKRHSLSH